jgi:hypothetical protein
MIPAALKVASVAAKYWKPIAAVLMVVAILLLVYAVGRSHANRAWERKYGEAVADWNAAVAKAEQQTSAAEAEARRTETAWRDHVSQREKEYRDDKAATTAALAAERVSNGRLRDAVDHFVRASGPAGDPGTTCGDLRGRVETLGLLVREADSLAGECAAAADRTRDSFALCRGYADALRLTQ